MTIHFFQKNHPSFAPQPSHPTASWKAHAMAWIYPGPPACNAMNEYKDGRRIDTLKPQYYTLSPSGRLVQLTTINTGCNAYSKENAEKNKKIF